MEFQSWTLPKLGIFDHPMLGKETRTDVSKGTWHSFLYPVECLDYINSLQCCRDEGLPSSPQPHCCHNPPNRSHSATHWVALHRGNCSPFALVLTPISRHGEGAGLQSAQLGPYMPECYQCWHSGIQYRGMSKAPTLSICLTLLQYAALHAVARHLKGTGQRYWQRYCQFFGTGKDGNIGVCNLRAGEPWKKLFEVTTIVNNHLSLAKGRGKWHWRSSMSLPSPMLLHLSSSSLNWKQK